MTDPLKEYAQSKEATKETRKEHEMSLWRTWKDNGQKPEHLEPLLKLYEPVFAQKIRLWKPKHVPESAFHAELLTHAIKAFETYDPNRGAALNTHVETRLPKAMRFMQRTQNFAYIPAGMSKYIGPITKARDELTETLGKEPTHEELSKHLREMEGEDYRELTPKRIGNILGAMRRDIPASKLEDDPTTRGHNFEEQQIAVAQNILPSLFPNDPAMHSLFHHTFGTDGHQKILSTGALAKKLGKSESQISRMKTRLGTTLQNFLNPEEDKKK